MRKFIKQVDALIQNMFIMGQGKAAKLNKREITILSRLEIVDYNDLPIAWRWMSTRANASLSAFKYCLFKYDYSYSLEIYKRLLGNEKAIRKLENWMFKNGYKAFDIYDTTASDCKLSLAIVNPKWSNDPPRGGNEYKIKHTGVSMIYDFYVDKPCAVGLCIPNGLRPYLEKFDLMEKDLQRFVVNQTKQCDGCRYCVQTDKTKLRPLAYFTIAFEGEEYKLCPLFPGYKYSWTGITGALADNLIRMLTFIDGLASGDF